MALHRGRPWDRVGCSAGGSAQCQWLAGSRRPHCQTLPACRPARSWARPAIACRPAAREHANSTFPLEASSPTYLHRASNTQPEAPGKAPGQQRTARKELDESPQSSVGQETQKLTLQSTTAMPSPTESKEKPLNASRNLQSTKASAAPRGDHIVTTQSVHEY